MFLYSELLGVVKFQACVVKGLTRTNLVSLVGSIFKT